MPFAMPCIAPRTAVPLLREKFYRTANALGARLRKTRLQQRVQTRVAVQVRSRRPGPKNVGWEVYWPRGPLGGGFGGASLSSDPYRGGLLVADPASPLNERDACDLPSEVFDGQKRFLRLVNFVADKEALLHSACMWGVVSSPSPSQPGHQTLYPEPDRRGFRPLEAYKLEDVEMPKRKAGGQSQAPKSGTALGILDAMMTCAEFEYAGTVLLPRVDHSAAIGARGSAVSVAVSVALEATVEKGLLSADVLFAADTLLAKASSSESEEEFVRDLSDEDTRILLASIDDFIFGDAPPFCAEEAIEASCFATRVFELATKRFGWGNHTADE